MGPKVPLEAPADRRQGDCAIGHFGLFVRLPHRKPKSWHKGRRSGRHPHRRHKGRPSAQLPVFLISCVLAGTASRARTGMGTTSAPRLLAIRRSPLQIATPSASPA